MTDLVCRVPNRFILASFQPNPHPSVVCEATPQNSVPVFSVPQRITNPLQVPLNRSLTARNVVHEANSFSQDISNFWSFNWWYDASGGERALGLGVAALAAVPTVVALGLAGVSSVLGVGCAASSEPYGGISPYLPDTGNVISPTAPADRDQDGFQSDMDCNDSDGSARPLDNRVVNSHLSICPGTYGQLNVSGSEFTIVPYYPVNPGVTVASIAFNNAHNVLISGLRVAGEPINRPDLFVQTMVNLRSSSRIYFDSMNVACPAGEAGGLCIEMLLNGSSQNIIYRSTFVYGLIGLSMDGSSNDNRVENCTFMDQIITNRNPYVDDGRNNTFINNTYRR